MVSMKVPLPFPAKTLERSQINVVLIDVDPRLGKVLYLSRCSVGNNRWELDERSPALAYFTDKLVSQSDAHDIP